MPQSSTTVHCVARSQSNCVIILYVSDLILHFFPLLSLFLTLYGGTRAGSASFGCFEGRPPLYLASVPEKGQSFHVSNEDACAARGAEKDEYRMVKGEG